MQQPDEHTLPPWRSVVTNGITMAVRATGFEDGGRLPVLFLHGFPELSYSWRHQLQALHAAGFGVAAPDLRGHGRTGPQGEPADYRMANLALDVTRLLDAMNVQRSVIVGRDFGGALAWTLARDHPDRVLGVVSLNTPYTRRTENDLVETVLRTRGATHYMATFQTPGVGEALLTADIRATFAGLMRRPAVSLAGLGQLPDRLRALPATLFTGEPEVMGEPLLSEEELGVFVQAFQQTGFTGALNWYRNLRRNWLDTADTADRVCVPALMVSAADDFFLPPDTTKGMERVVADLERYVIQGCGHWTQQERPDVLNALLLEWLRRRMLPRWLTTDARTRRFSRLPIANTPNPCG
jgi:pimeloyl-ACP methyl ester carboxylesterase